MIVFSFFCFIKSSRIVIMNDLINTFLNFIKNEKRFSIHTQKSYRNDLLQFYNYVQKDFGIENLKNVKYDMVRSWVVSLLENGLSERTVNRKLSSLRSFYKYLVQKTEITENPVGNIKALKQKKRLPTFVKQESMNRLFERSFYPEDFVGERDRMIISMLYYTGMRLSELIELKQIAINNKEIKVFGKGAKERIIPISESFYQIIKEYIQLKENNFSKTTEYFLVTDKGQKMYEKFVFRKVNHYLSLVTTQKKRSPHVLRHTFATQMLSNGADLNAVKELLGHESLMATQVYTHNSLEKLKGIYKQSHPRSEKKQD